MVSPAEIREAINLLETGRGVMSAVEANNRVDACRRAVTPRDLWKASGGRAGDRMGRDWQRFRTKATTVVVLLAFLAVTVRVILVGWIAYISLR